MRRALWILTAPVVAGGLAWAVNAADNQGPLLAGAPQAQNGKIFYFSRGGKSATAANANESVDGADDSSADDDADTPPVAQRYVRNRTVSSASTKPAVKNYYQDLFADSDAAPASGSSANLQSASRRAPKTAAAAAPSQARRKVILEECGINDSSDSDLAHEDVPLPAASGKNQLVGGTKGPAGVRHADHQVRAGATNRNIQQVQNTARSGSAKGRLSQAAPAVDRDLEDPIDDDDVTAPVAPRSVKPVKTSKTAAPKSSRSSANIKPAQHSPAKPPKKPEAAPKVQPVAAVEDEDQESAVVPAAAQQVVVAATSTDDVPMVSLRWTKNDEVNVGQECKCGLLVKNTGKLAAKDIVVEAYFPRTVRLVDADPSPSDSKDHLVWIFELLEPGQEKAIEVTMIPGRRGEVATSATVRFTGVASSVLKVEEPQLSLAIAGTREVMVGDSLTQIITVSNPGTGIAHDVVVHARIPEGLEHPRGKTVEMGVGSLGPGESRELRLPLSAVNGGDAVLLVEARGSSNLSQRAQNAIRIAAPKLSVEVTGPGLRYVSRHAQYVVTVTNDGIAATDNVRVVHLVPEGFEFIRADKGGKFDAASGSVSWFIGRLEAGQSMQVAVDLNAKQIGEYLHHVQASGENGTIATARATTRVDGTAAVVMEVADLDDPVEVGTQTAYEIRVRNDGSKAAQNLRIACELPKGVDLIDTKGPTDHSLEKGVLHFKPLSELPAGSKIVYVIRVNGKVPGNLRLRAKLTSNASTEPLIVEEMTKFYAD
ncbi:MAG TPA: hypothetical protein VKU82_00980 [Planctomycetaceae bacterium]|nr:hypothetical protein [Planctomycetaceae bacterium]